MHAYLGRRAHTLPRLLLAEAYVPLMESMQWERHITIAKNARVTVGKRVWMIPWMIIFKEIVYAALMPSQEPI